MKAVRGDIAIYRAFPGIELVCRQCTVPYMGTYEESERRRIALLSRRLQVKLGKKHIDAKLVLADGSVVAESGTHEKLMHKNGLYRRLVNLQTAAADLKIRA